VLLGLIERAVGAQLGLDLVVCGQRLRVFGAELARRLFLGEGEIVDSVLGHDAGRGRGDPRARAGLPRPVAAHRSVLMAAFREGAGPWSRTRGS